MLNKVTLPVLLTISIFASGQLFASVAYMPGEVIVKYKQKGAALSAVGVVSQLRESLTTNIDRVKLNTDVTVEQAVEHLNQQSNIEYAQPNYIKRLQTVPNDPLFNLQWGLSNTGQAVQGTNSQFVSGFPGADIDAVSAWDVTTGSSSIIVAVVDSGIDDNHPDLKPNLWHNPEEIPNNGIDDDDNGFIDDDIGWDMVSNDNKPFDLNGHGTHVAGIVAARGNDGANGSGVNWSSSLMVLRALDENGLATTATAVEAINYAVNNGARIINTSYGSDILDSIERDAIANAGNNGVLVVAAACNEGNDSDKLPCYPASYDLSNIIAVAATDQFDNLASFSNRGATSVDVGAPGVNIVSTFPDFQQVWFDDLNSASLWAFGGVPDTWTISGGLLNDSPGGSYAQNSNNWAMSPQIDLTGEKNCRLIADIATAQLSSPDKVSVEASADQNQWQTLNEIDNTVSQFTGKVYVDLGGFSGTGPFYFRTRLQTDNFSELDGIKIRSFEIQCPSANYQNANALLDGTSAAAPFVSGVAALVLSQRSTLTAQELASVLINSVDTSPSLTGNVVSNGRIDAAGALFAQPAPGDISQQQNNATKSNSNGKGTGLLGPTEILIGLLFARLISLRKRLTA
ncbi:MAG: S8 family serine peptidase [Gammaproteobacteria bacterium]